MHKTKSHQSTFVDAEEGELIECWINIFNRVNTGPSYHGLNNRPFGNSDPHCILVSLIYFPEVELSTTVKEEMEDETTNDSECSNKSKKKRKLKEESKEAEKVTCKFELIPLRAK